MALTQDLAADVRRVRGSVTDAQFARIVKDLSAAGLSVRGIAALVNRPKSVVGRAVKAPPDTAGEVWKRTPLPVLYDVFREAANSLSAVYVGCQRRAKAKTEAHLWAELRRDLIETRDLVSTDDRDLMARLTQEWAEEAPRPPYRRRRRISPHETSPRSSGCRTGQTRLRGRHVPSSRRDADAPAPGRSAKPRACVGRACGPSRCLPGSPGKGHP
jgi:hypothetical protein